MNQINQNTELSALIGVDSFFYAHFDPSNDLLSSGKITSSSVDGLIKHEGIANTIGKARFGIVENRFSIVPQSEFDSAHLKEYLIRDTELNEGEKLIYRSDLSEKFGVRIVYAVLARLVKDLNDHFQQPSLSHFTTALMDSYDYSASSSDCIMACLYENSLSLVAIKNQRLQLANIYNVADDLSLLYFLNLVFEKLDYNKEETPIIMSGEIDSENDSWKGLKRYFGNISVGDSAFFKDSELKPNDSMLYPLSCIAQCA